VVPCGCEHVEAVARNDDILDERAVALEGVSAAAKLLYVAVNASEYGGLV
jgi:hypothetical protein